MISSNDTNPLAARRGADVRQALADEITERHRREADEAFARLHPPAPTPEERRASIMRRLFNEDRVSADDLEWLRAAGVSPRPIVMVCAWCPDHVEQTAAARAHGFDVSHGMCSTCEAKFGS